jgi:hypothetical protein
MVDIEMAANSCVEVTEQVKMIRVRTEASADYSQGALNAACSDATSTDEVSRAFTFNGAFGPSSTQQDVFSLVGRPVLDGCLQGLNGTILGYGQTGSGKTHSLLHQGSGSDDAGLLPRLVASLFLQISRDDSLAYDIQAAALQVYNEQVDDLFADREAGQGFNLPVLNNGMVPGLTWVACNSPSSLLEAFSRARSNLVYAETRMNKHSSRSHAIFQVKITCRKRHRGGDSAQQIECTVAKLNVVDLAGSERVKKSGVEGTQLKEALAINKSLLVFGNVVSALAAKRTHVPFRESKLTRILDGSIGGNSRTSLLVCVSPSTENAAETLSALEFASRAMRVEVDARVNRSLLDANGLDVLQDQSRSQLSEMMNRSLLEELENVKRAALIDRARAEEAERLWQAAEARSQSLELELDEARRGHSDVVARHSEERLALEASIAESNRVSEDLRQNAEMLAGDLIRVKAERDAALERAILIEAELETEYESLMAEVEASAERDIGRQREFDALLADSATQLSAAERTIEELRSEVSRLETLLEDSASSSCKLSNDSSAFPVATATRRNTRVQAGKRHEWRSSISSSRACSADVLPYQSASTTGNDFRVKDSLSPVRAC